MSWLHWRRTNVGTRSAGAAGAAWAVCIPPLLVATVHHFIDASLENWSELREECEFTGLLIGNGASRVVWSKFAYESLFDLAKGGQGQIHLTDEDVALFETLATRNFERVLSALRTAIVVSDALGRPKAALEARYVSVRNALAAAVHHTHVPWSLLHDAALDSIREALVPYRFVYSTNYDLLIYWAIMRGEGGFKDLFWDEYFDLSDTELWGKDTAVLYLHGGLHLYRTPQGRTLKRRASVGHNLLDLFGTPFIDDASPLFIAEGTSNDKRQSIYQSDYLAFAFATLAHHKGPLAVFGHSLGESDDHIIEAICGSGVRDIAISVRSGPSDRIIARKAEVTQKLPKASLRFFDAATHPLGDVSLEILGGDDG